LIGFTSLVVELRQDPKPSLADCGMPHPFFFYLGFGTYLVNDCCPPKPNAFLPEQKKTKNKNSKENQQNQDKKGQIYDPRCTKLLHTMTFHLSR